ncbi:MAG: acyl-CoA dehydrogenase family protein [Deltaproteobacteria bacterium]|nr:acyl-CoA dehydrogenase family protein [Deltaproteobacteria bacterium]MBW2053405.1 acyl-CoA dehydrogenase family protein [Deltaproteobacteria bacterium]MBW2142078.1 acyl-CoA dehydrogenase family protein [Deltaproteobacteria bacterium]MBW2323900.1 acyl-CoA dehydrogenase family protein [Deltaproteobacteria bacterium]
MEFKLTEEQQALKKEYDDFFREEMKAAPSEFRQNSLEAIYGTVEGWEFHRHMQKKLAEKGWLTMAWPKEFGGREAPIIEQLIFSEVHAYYRAPGIDGFGMGMFAPTLMLFANEEQKERLLGPIGRGEVNYCQGWSEPNAGSDLAALTTTAIKEGDHYVVNGQKVWTTGAHRADRMFLLARTDPSQRRSSGLSVFNVDMSTPGIEVRPIHYMDGKHLYNEIFLTDVIIPEYDLIGSENEGWKSTRATMNFERSGVGSFASAKRMLEELLEYVKTTKRGGKFLYENPVVRQKLAKLYIDIERGRALAYKVAWNQEKEKFLLSATGASASKVFGSELFQRITNFATEIMGMHGQLNSSKWAPLGGVMSGGYQWCMGMNIAAGSSEIQRNIIAWVGVGLPRFK